MNLKPCERRLRATETALDFLRVFNANTKLDSIGKVIRAIPSDDDASNDTLDLEDPDTMV